MAGTDQPRAEPVGGASLVPPERPSLDQYFDEGDLYALRSAVAAHGSQLGLADQALADLVLVAHELATNAVRHGGVGPAAPGRLRLWATQGQVVCQVHDHGQAPARLAEAGRTLVEPSANNGRGLWIIRQLVTHLDVTVGADGTTLTAVVAASL